MQINGLNSSGVVLKNNTNVLDIAVPEWLKNRAATGVQWFDEAFAGGLVKSQVIMFTAPPGAGKTTLSFQIADALTKLGHIVVYNTREESPEQVALKAQQLQLKSGFILAQHIFVKELLEQLDHLKREANDKDKHVFLFQDSLPTLDDGFYRGKPGSKNYNRSVINSATAGRAMNMLTDYAKKEHATAVVINHVTKGGQFVGKNEVKHMIDTHMELSIDKDDNSRVFEVPKNRFGDTSSKYVIGMSASGLQLLNKIDRSPNVAENKEANEELDNLEKAEEKVVAKRRRRGMGLRAV